MHCWTKCVFGLPPSPAVFMPQFHSAMSCLLWQTELSSCPHTTWMRQSCWAIASPSSPRDGCAAADPHFSSNPTLAQATTSLWWKERDSTPTPPAAPASAPAPAPAPAPTSYLPLRSLFFGHIRRLWLIASVSGVSFLPCISCIFNVLVDDDPKQKQHMRALVWHLVPCHVMSFHLRPCLRCRTASHPWVKTRGWEVRRAAHVSIWLPHGHTTMQHTCTFQELHWIIVTERILKEVTRGRLCISLCPCLWFRRPRGAAFPAAAAHPRRQVGRGVGTWGRHQPAADGCQGQQPGSLPVRTGSEDDGSGYQQLRPLWQHVGGGGCCVHWLAFKYIEN